MQSDKPATCIDSEGARRRDQGGRRAQAKARRDVINKELFNLAHAATALAKALEYEPECADEVSGTAELIGQQLNQLADELWEMDSGVALLKAVA